MNNPINATDPTGLCGFLGDGPCTPGGVVDDLADRSPVRGQDAANFAGGVLNGITLGNADTVLGALGQDEKVRWNSSATAYGNLAALLLDAPCAIVAPEGFVSYAASATKIDLAAEVLGCLGVISASNEALYALRSVTSFLTSTFSVPFGMLSGGDC